MAMIAGWRLWWRLVLKRKRYNSRLSSRAGAEGRDSLEPAFRNAQGMRSGPCNRQEDHVIRGVPYLKFALLLLLLFCSACTTPSAADRTAPPAAAREKDSGAETPYYVEFRARPSFVGGHTYLVYGALGKDGEPAERNVAGFEPSGGIFGLFVGIVAAPGEIKKSFLDDMGADIDKYRRNLTATEYQHLIAYVAEQRQRHKVWNIFLNNCNDFAADAALAVGLKVPADRFIISPLFVLMLSSMNT